MGYSMTIDERAAATGDVGVFEPGQPVIDPIKMLRIHGYKDMDKVRPIIRKTADQIAERAAGVMSPIVHYRRLIVESCRGGALRLADGATFSNHAFDRYLGDAGEVAVVVITVGKGLDDEVIGCMDEFEPLEALFLETAGWLGIEWTTRQFVAHLGGVVEPEGLRLTRRMGPGYSYKVDGDPEMW